MHRRTLRQGVAIASELGWKLGEAAVAAGPMATLPREWDSDSGWLGGVAMARTPHTNTFLISELPRRAALLRG